MSTFCKRLNIEVSMDPPEFSDGEYDPSIEMGMQDFLNLMANIDNSDTAKNVRLDPLVPAGLVRDVLKRCRKGGMTKTEFSHAIEAISKIENKNTQIDINGKDLAWNSYLIILNINHDLKDKAPSYSDLKYLGIKSDDELPSKNKIQSWSRYYINNQQMKICNMKHFIYLAQHAGWLDKRTPPSEPHPSEWKWEDPRPDWLNRSQRRWRVFERPSDVDIFLERIDTIEACIAIYRAGEHISMENVRNYFYFEQPFRREYESIFGKATVSQRLKKARGKKSLAEVFNPPNTSSREIIDFLYTNDDEEANAQKKQMADNKIYKRNKMKKKNTKT